MSAKFNYAIEKYLQHEGGYQNNRNDKGNFNSLNQNIGTNFGISAQKLEEFLRRVPTVLDMRNLSLVTVKNIYKKDWDKWRLETIVDTFTAYHCFDIMENSGFTGGSRIIQRAINKILLDLKKPLITVDNFVGTKSIAAINLIHSLGQSNTLNKQIVSDRTSFFIGLENSTFQNGWITRAKSFLNYVAIETPITSIIPIVTTVAIFFLTYNYFANDRGSRNWI